jgi:hypothetical protein
MTKDGCGMALATSLGSCSWTGLAGRFCLLLLHGLFVNHLGRNFSR